MDRTGIVVDQMGDFSKVKLLRHTACGNCGACQLGDEQKDIMLVARNSAKASVGDMVEVSMATGGVLSAAFIMYVIPLFGLFVGLMLGQLLFEGNDGLVALVGVLLMGMVFFIIKLNDKRFLKNEKYTAQILNILQSDHATMVPLS